MEWVAVVAAGVSLIVSAATLIVAVLILRTASRSEQAGDERLELLREQRQRLAYLDEERSTLLDTLELLRRQMDESKRRPEPPPAPPGGTETAAEGPEEGTDTPDTGDAP